MYTTKENGTHFSLLPDHISVVYLSTIYAPTVPCGLSCDLGDRPLSWRATARENYSTWLHGVIAGINRKGVLIVISFPPNAPKTSLPTSTTE